MSTANFHNINSTKIFAVLMNYFDEEIQENVYPDEWQYRDFKDNIYYEIMSAAKKTGFNFYDGGKKDENELRSYPSSSICGMYTSKKIGGLNVEVTITSILRSAYYEGANLDWQINICIHDEIDLNQDEFINEYDYYSDYKGICKKHAETAYKWAKKTADLLSEELEKIYSNYSIKYNEVGRFSNGEAIYQIAS